MKWSGETSIPATLILLLPNASVPTSTIVWPPSTGITAPLTYDASGESSQATVPAISSGVLGRRSGTSCVTVA